MPRPPSGRPKGTPKTGGRQPGTPNKATAAIKPALDALGLRRDGADRHLQRLNTLTASTDEGIAVKALAIVLAYRFGKPPEFVTVVGDPDRPLLIKIVDAAA